jgi:hypothetical protein
MHNIDIATTVKVILVFIALGIFACVYYGLNSLLSARRLEFFQKKRIQVTYGWRLFFIALLLAVGGFWIFKNAEPIAYRYFPPSPTMTRTPTITLTPTITPTLQWTQTPTVTETLEYTYTPGLPFEALATIQTPIGPDVKAVFSALHFSTRVDENFQIVDEQTNFETPVTHIYGGFSFAEMAYGVQWTAVWLYEGKVIFLETKVWTTADGTGGTGYTDCQRPASEWLPGNYEVQIFVGSTWKKSGRFTISGSVIDTPTPTLSATSSPIFKTNEPLISPTVTETPTP